MAPANTQSIGKVFIVHGTVKAVSPAGVERILTPNSPVYAHEHIVTGSDGSVSIALADHHGHLDLGRMSDVLLDQDVYGAGGHGGAADAIADVKDIQAALESGNIDPTTDLPEPGAGPGVGVAGGAAGGGRHIVVFDADHMEVLPDSGAETSGIARNFLDPPPGGLPEDSSTPHTPDQPPDTPPIHPVLGTVEVTVDEADLPYGSHHGPGDPTQSGSAEQLGVRPGDTLDFGNDQIITIGDSSDTSLVVHGKYGDLTINSDGSWTYELTGNTLDHHQEGKTGTDDQVNDPFSFTVTDPNGNAVPGEGSIVVHVLDDGPSLVVGDQQVYEHGLVASDTGTVTVTGTLEIDYGADGHNADNALVLSSEGATWDAKTNTLTENNGAWTLHVNDDGTYTFTLNQALDHDKAAGHDLSLDIPINVVVTDGDGDSASGSFKITVFDDNPSLKVGDQQVYEHGLVHSGTVTVDGTLEINYGADGPHDGNALVLSSEGATWDATTNTLTENNGAWTLHVNDDGTYTFTLNQALDHDKAAGHDLSLDIPINVVVTDGDGDSMSGSFKITVFDDTPKAWHHPDDTHLPNEAGDQVSGHLHLAFGADGPAHDLALQLGDSGGNSLVGQLVVDDHGNPLTSGGHQLVYVDDGAGGVHAVIDGTDQTVFSVSLDAEHRTYTVTMGDHALDPQHATMEFSSDAGLDAGNNFQLGDDVTVHVTGTYTNNDGHETQGNVTWTDGGLGVNDGSIGSTDHVIGDGDTLTMNFSQALESVHVTLTGVNVIVDPDSGSMSVASYTTYLDGNQVDSGIVKLNADGSVTLDLQSTGSFDSISFSTATKGTAYEINSLTIDQTGYHPELSYTVLATDSDGDSVRTDVFHVTFNSDSASGIDHDHSGDGSHYRSGDHGVFDGDHGPGHGGGGEGFVDSGGSDHGHHVLDHLVGPVGHH
ncbi:MAG: retention module-containing protein [Proteobacteria bacterium]|nr:retention module-containing protein [Pseudomonadota bacterium]